MFQRITIPNGESYGAVAVLQVASEFARTLGAAPNEVTDLKPLSAYRSFAVSEALAVDMRSARHCGLTGLCRRSGWFVHNL